MTCKVSVIWAYHTVAYIPAAFFTLACSDRKSGSAWFCGTFSNVPLLWCPRDLFWEAARHYRGGNSLLHLN